MSIVHFKTRDGHDLPSNALKYWFFCPKSCPICPSIFGDPLRIESCLIPKAKVKENSTLKRYLHSNIHNFYAWNKFN